MRERRAARERLGRGASGLAVAVALSMAGCNRASSRSDRYLVTSSAIDVGLGIRLCVAVESRDPHGVWWWQPGASGCTSRSTGPDVFHIQEATVSRSAPPGVTVAFRLGTHSLTRPSIDVRLAIEDGRMRSLDTGDAVAVQRRSDLEIPEQPPGP